jgi:DNA replication and repair protein RecF
MLIENISLTNFRNYDQVTFNFSDGINLILGDNATGKTNLLEAVYLLSSGRSFRAGRINQMINYDSPIAHIKGLVKKSDQDSLAIASVLSRGEVNGQKTPLRQFSVAGVKRSQFEFVGNLLTVLFSPQDLDIVTDSPSWRRRYLDEVLNQSNPDYYRANLSYQKGLRSRNKVLEQIRSGQTTTKTLFFWDQLLLENGAKINRGRQELVDFMNRQKSAAQYKIIYRPSLISPQKLVEEQTREIAAAKTLFGPHRDDFSVLSTDRDLAIFGSRGEQRLSVLWLKLGQLRFLEEIKNERPVLLLDDIFSELDPEHKKLVVASFIGHQTLVTTAEPIDLDYQNNLIKLT